MGGSVWTSQVGSTARFSLKMHFTLLLLLGWLLLDTPQEGTIMPGALLACAFFFAVAVQALGMLLAAHWAGSTVSELVLFPFGAQYSLHDGADGGMRNWFVPLALPLANAAAGGCLWLAALVWHGEEYSWLEQAAVINWSLALLNTVPAFPFAGGRLLFNLLQHFHARAARAVFFRASPVVAALLFLLALTAGNAAELFVAATALALAVRALFQENARSALSEFKVDELLIARDEIRCLSHATLVSEALRVMLRSTQDTFPVLHNGELLGIVEKDSLLRSSAINAGHAYVAEYMRRSVPALSPEAGLDAALDALEAAKLKLLPIVSDNHFVGAVLKEKILELLLIKSIEKHVAAEDDGSKMFGEQD